MLTFNEWLARYGPENRAYTVIDLREGWEAAMRELIVDRWQFRVSNGWHDIPVVCIRPMLELFGAEIEMRPIFMEMAGRSESGVALLARLDESVPIPF